MTLSTSLKHLTVYLIVFSRSKSSNACNYRINYNISTVIKYSKKQNIALRYVRGILRFNFLLPKTVLNLHVYQLS